MADLDTTVAVYKDGADADLDWTLLEDGVLEEKLDIADAALVENQAGEAVILERHSPHGWGKGAVAGAVVGVLFPPSLIGMTIVGAGGGELVARFTRSLGRGKVKDLGEAIDKGSTAIVVICPTDSTPRVIEKLKNAQSTTTAPSGTVDDVKQAMAATD